MSALTEQQLAEIRAREAAAFHGPWFVVAVRDADDCGDTVVGVATADDTFIFSTDESMEMTIEDAEFIAFAREDVPALLAEADRLGAALSRIAAYCTLPGCGADCPSMVARHVLGTTRPPQVGATPGQIDAHLVALFGEFAAEGYIRQLIDSRTPVEVEDAQNAVSFHADKADALEKRVVELATERHSTNEALSDAAEAIRVKDQRIAELEGRPSVPQPPARRPVDPNSQAARLARIIAAKYAKDATTELVDGGTLAVYVSPVSLGDWDWWLSRFHVETGQTTHRGSYATAKGNHGHVKVLLTGHGVPALYAAERAQSGGAL